MFWIIVRPLTVRQAFWRRRATGMRGRSAFRNSSHELTEIGLLREDSSEQIRAARMAISNGDAGALQEVGHALRGTLSNLSAPTAASFAGELESMGIAFKLASAAATLAKLEAELARVIESLEGLCLEPIQ